MLRAIKNRFSPEFKQRTATVGRIAVPVIGANIAQNLLLVIDTAMVGRFSTRSLAAVGIATSVFHVLLLIGNSLAVGTHTSLAHYLGGRDKRRATLTALSGTLLSILAAAAMIGTCSLIKHPVFRFMNLDTALYRETDAYYGIMMFSFLFLLPSAMMKSVFAVRMQTRTIFVSSAIMCVINVVGDYVLIYGKWGFPRMGVRGAAAASLIAGACALINYCMHLPLRGRMHEVVAMLRRHRSIARQFRRIALFALPTTFEWSFWVLGIFFINRFVVPYGAVSIALFHTCLKLQRLFALPAAGFNQAGLTLVGKAYGAGDYHQIPAWKQTILGLGIAIGMVGFLLMIAIPRPLLSLFISAQDLATLHTIRLVMAMSGVLVIAKITNIIMGSVLRSMGHIRYFVFLSTFSCVLAVSLGWTFTDRLHLGVAGAFGAMLFDELLRNLIHLVKFKRFARAVGIPQLGPVASPARSRA